MLMTRYLLKNLLSATIFIALTLTMVIWLTQSLRLLELIANSDAPPLLFIKLTALTLPRFLEVILPFSLVAGCLFIYHKFIMDNELIVLRSCGFDQYALAKPALLLACMMTIVILSLTTYISPRCYAEMQTLRREVKAQYSTFLLREGIFNVFGSDLTVYLRAREESGDLVGLVIHDSRDKDVPPVTVTAKRGRIVMAEDIPQIIVYDGMRQQIDPNSNVVSKLFFQRYTIEIKGLEGTARKKRREASERTFIELLNPDLGNKKDMADRKKFLAEAHRRIITPFNAISFTLTALCCLLLGTFNRRGQNKKIMAATFLVLMLQTLSMVLTSAAKDSLLFLSPLYAVTLIPIGLGLFLLNGRGEEWLTRNLRHWRRRLTRQAPAAAGEAPR